MPALKQQAEQMLAYLNQTDALLDGPTVRIFEHMRDVQTRMMKQCQELRAEFPALGKVDRNWLDALSKQESEISSVVA